MELFPPPASTRPMQPARRPRGSGDGAGEPGAGVLGVAEALRGSSRVGARSPSATSPAARWPGSGCDVRRSGYSLASGGFLIPRSVLVSSATLRPVAVEPAATGRDRGELGPAVHAELAVDVPEVSVDRLRRDEQRG